MSRQFRIPGRSKLVVVYYGTDPHHHRRNPTDPQRPACRPILEPGVLTNQRQAEAEGTTACPDCWPDDKQETKP